MKKTILVVGGHSWQTGSPEPLLSQVRALGLEDVEIKGVPYKGYLERGSMTKMVMSIIKAIDDCPGKPYIIGYSAGGQLAMCAARLRPKQVAGVISFCGALDFASIPQIPLLVRLFLKGMDPVKWAREIRMPLLLIHGADDTMVHPEASSRFYALAQAAQKHLLYVPGKGHDVSCLADAKDALKAFLS
jgi:pimeloyl-ACP methyl ester carboxylesterase